MTAKAPQKRPADLAESRPKNKKPRAGLKDFRIIVRNLPFSTTVDDISAHFGTIGSIKDIQLPKCKDPRFPNSSAGFAFIQYNSREAARKAIDSMNATQFKGRKIAIDWTLNKDEYISSNLEKNEKQRMLAVASKVCAGKNKREIKMEEEEESDSDSKDSDDEESTPIKKEIKEEEEDDDSGGEEEIGDAGESDDEELPPKPKRAERKPDTAVEEGRVIFLRNLSFDTTSEALKEHVSQYGDVSLAILCKFPGTDQPTGNAFVHFKEKESADRCLEELEASGLFIDGRIVEGHRAVSREEAVKFKDKPKQGKDKRNLKLLRVSYIRANTKQARGMSEEDAQLRRRLANTARIKLKNLHMFVSKTRLSIHNLPFDYRDNDLRELCLQHATKNARIIECRIMRNKKGKDKHGRAMLGKSKGFGFVEFTEHLDALTCLRNMNNDPSVFTDQRRPIVEFAIENLKALKIKEKRRQPKDTDAPKKSR